MEVILKEDVPKLGHRGEVVKVAEGYGRNYLLPKKLAIEATAANRVVIEQMKHSAIRKSAVEKADAESLAKQLDGTALSFQRKAGEKDHLFGSVTSADIAEALERKGFNIDRRKIQLHEALKSLGDFDVPIRLHRDVISQVKVTVQKEAEA
ncbi:MAG TPA: 50S ribosomal protein L9 [Candidatus Sulfotelmatobacter sp.]|jgi:large subunit ribosomal protein L9|nr:50S ribosomal protein L9 [Candidatus Sulfotelmatobacter sp.]